MSSSRPKREIFQYTNCFLTSKYDLADSASGPGYNQNFKIHYRKLFLRFVLSKIDESNDSASQIVKPVNVLMVIGWVAEA